LGDLFFSQNMKKMGTNFVKISFLKSTIATSASNSIDMVVFLMKTRCLVCRKPELKLSSKASYRLTSRIMLRMETSEHVSTLLFV